MRLEMSLHEGLLREGNELGKRLEKGGKGLLLLNAGSHLAALGTGQEELSTHQLRPQKCWVCPGWKQCWALQSRAPVEPAGLEVQWHTPSCGRKGHVPAQTSVASCFLCSLVCFAHSCVFSEHPSLGCTTCAFLHLPLSSFCFCSTWICSVCLANSKTLPYLDLILSVFGLYLNCGL